MAETVDIKRFGAKRKYPKDIGMKEFYNYYVSQLDKVELEEGYNVPEKLYGTLVSEINLGLSNALLEANYIQLPCRLGNLGIYKREKKPYIDDNGVLKNVNIDWANTRKLWKEDNEAFEKATKVYYQNEHTDKYLYYWKWDKGSCNFTNKTVYKFLPIRKAVRTLSSRLKNPTTKVDYYTHINYYKLNANK